MLTKIKLRALRSSSWHLASIRQLGHRNHHFSWTGAAAAVQAADVVMLGQIVALYIFVIGRRNGRARPHRRHHDGSF